MTVRAAAATPETNFFCTALVWQCQTTKNTQGTRTKTTGRDADRRRTTTTSGVDDVVFLPPVRPQYGVNGDGGTSPFTPFWGRGHRWRWST